MDDSPEMLSHVRAARTVLSRVETVNLPERFDGVIMASHLANAPADEQRHALYRAARRHLAPTGVVFVEWHPPEWFDRLTVGSLPASTLGDITTALRVHAIEAGRIDATVTYELDDSTWTRHFQTRRISEAELLADFDTCDLAFDTFLDESRTWFQVSAR